MIPVNRIAPQLPVGQVKTYTIAKPNETHTRPASCTEVGCNTQAMGWRTTIDEATPLGQRQAHYVRRQSGRAHTEHREGALTVFVFPPGQECFADHRVSLDRPEFYIVRGGDWRGQVGTQQQFSGPDSWVNHFAEHQERLARSIN